MASGGEEYDPECSNASVGTWRRELQGRSTEGAYLIHLESFIERPWRACEGDRGLKRPQPLAGRVRRLVRYGNIAQVIHMVFHQLNVGRLPHGLRVQVGNDIESIVFAPFPRGNQEDSVILRGH